MVRTLMLAAMVGLFLSGPARAQDWGEVKGQVVWAGGKGALKLPNLKVDKDVSHCLSKGPIPDEKFVINPKNLGLKDVFVYLAPLSDGPLPIHPDLKAIAKKQVELDQPCCRYIPRAFVLRVGQELLLKNTSPIQHNVKADGKNIAGGGFNVLLPAGKSVAMSADKFKAERLPAAVACNIHPWMKAWLLVVDHPYATVTDENGNFTIPKAPAGKYRLIAWQEGCGWITGGRDGMVIEIKKGEPTVLPPLKATDEE